MKKWALLATALFTAGCYTPLNNSGVSTTKPWLEVPAKRVDFDGKQYDSCVQFKLHFWPPEVQERLDLQKACITACCWRSEGNEIVLDFNRGFDEELAQNGHARQYTPGTLTLKVSHSNFVNTTKVSVSPRGAIKNSGLVKLSYQEIEDPARLAQLAQERTRQEQPPTGTLSSPKRPSSTRPVSTTTQAKALLQHQAGTQIDTYFYRMNQLYSRQQAVFILSPRLFRARLQEDGTYRVTCHAKARTGVDENHLRALDFPCGVWRVDLTTRTVSPADPKSREIWQLK